MASSSSTGSQQTGTSEGTNTKSGSKSSNSSPSTDPTSTSSGSSHPTSKTETSESSTTSSHKTDDSSRSESKDTKSTPDTKQVDLKSSSSSTSKSEDKPTVPQIISDDTQDREQILEEKRRAEENLAAALAQLSQSRKDLEKANRKINQLKGNPQVVVETSSEGHDDAPIQRTQSRALTQSRRAEKASLTDSVLRLHREVSTRTTPAPVKQLIQEPCSICLSDEPLHPLEDCKHSFCAGCLSAYFSSAVSEIDLPIKCPDRSCAVHVNTNDVEKFLTPVEFQKFLKFMMKLERPELRDCPYCQTMNQPQADTNKIVCSKCEQIYCLLHSNAHPPTISCYQYEKSLRKKDKKNNKVLKQTRRCPQCGIFTERTEGCPMMTCSQCDSKWCYLCGAFVKGNSEAGYRCPDCGASAFRHKKDPSCQSCVLGLLCFPCWGTCGLLYSLLCGPICCCIAACDNDTSFDEAYQLCCCPFDIVKDWFWCPCCYTDHDKLYEKRSEKIWGKEMEDVPFQAPPKKVKKKKKEVITIDPSLDVGKKEDKSDGSNKGHLD